MFISRRNKTIRRAWLTMTAFGLCLAGLVAASGAMAADSDPKPVPKGGPRAQAITAYNDGVKLMLERKYPAAQGKFEAALALDETIAEAHNNLAFSLRVQGTQNFERALAHYNRALEIDPKLARAYMYRGVLFVQKGDLGKARADHARLLGMDAKLAARLKEAIDSFPMGESYDGLAPQFD